MDISRNVSRASGWVASVYVPIWLRSPLFSTFSKTYNVVEDDMLQPFSEFTTFNEFFTRRVKQRVINPDENILLSPADSKVLTIAEVTGDSNILVKGINYKLGEFLTGRREVVLEDELFKTLKLKDQANKIYQVIFYLNPGDYHRYHSPTEVLVKRSNHILGYLAPVKESYIATHEVISNSQYAYLFTDHASSPPPYHYPESLRRQRTCSSVWPVEARSADLSLRRSY